MDSPGLIAAPVLLRPAGRRARHRCVSNRDSPLELWLPACAHGKSFLNDALMTIRRRALVLSDEAAGHPFLRSLPPHVRKVEPEPAGRRSWRFGWSDVRTFLAAYCASFLAISIFIY